MPKTARDYFFIKTRIKELRRKADRTRDDRQYLVSAKFYEALLRLEPDNGPLHVQCGHMFKEAGDLVAAERHYAKALSLMPNDADLSLQIGHFYKVAGRLSESLSAYKRALLLEPGWAEPISEALRLSGDKGPGARQSPRHIAAPSPAAPPDVTHLFDPDFYQSQSGVAVDGLEHYRTIGWSKGFDPHPLLSSSYYARCLKRPMQGDPLSDFVQTGAGELAEVHPLLDVRRYSRLAGGVEGGELHPLLHYLGSAGRHSIDGLRLFDQHFYAEQCPGLSESGFPPLVHYLKFGWKEGRKPHRTFTPDLVARLAGLAPSVEPLSAMVEFLLQEPESWAPRPVEISIIILNLSKSVLTLQCLFVLNRFTDMTGIEVIVVDNGSSPDEFRTLARYASNCTVLRSDSNLGFGEANNVAAETAAGKYLLFLNNDAFVSEGWLPPLRAAMQEQGVGAAGPLFLYPNGLVQEAGGAVNSDGQVQQRGKGSLDINPRHLRRRRVDYISAATIMVDAALFRQILGFDLIWDPAYYEDVDLCLKIKLAGFQIAYEPASRICHLENTTSTDSSLNLQLHTVVNANRGKFVQRWADYLDSGLAEDAPKLLPASPPPRAAQARPLLALFTPYPVNPGGGERYLLSFAHELRDEFDCVFYTPQFTSKVRMLTMGRELGLSLDHVRCVRWENVAGERRPDVFVSMGNEVLPYASPIGRKNFFICQFPFPLEAEHFRRDWGKLNRYDGVILYSSFVQQHYELARGALHLPPCPISIISPPIAPVRGTRPDRSAVRKILNVGRFHPGGHCKRQDVMIEAFKDLLAVYDAPVELHLAGSLGGEGAAREYLAALQQAGQGLPIHFHVNSSLEQLSTLFLDAEIYWHATGINEDVSHHPERFEHFGITILEAMSAGSVPVSLKSGGPGSIIQDGENGFLIADRAELVSATLKVLSLDAAQGQRIRSAAKARAAQYAPAVFKSALLSLFNDAGGAPG